MEFPRNDELLSAYLDRELSPDERAAMDRMLERSPAARARLEELQSTSRFLRGLQTHTPGPDFADSVVERLRSESLLRPAPVEPVRPPRRLSWRVSGSLAAAAAILIAVWTVQIGIRRHHADLLRRAELDLMSNGLRFDVLGPDGDPRFQLIVFDESADGHTVRCLLVDKSGAANAAANDAPTASRTGPGAGAQATAQETPPRTLQADREQLEALAQVFAMGNAASNEPFPILDIDASIELHELVLKHPSTDPPNGFNGNDLVTASDSQANPNSGDPSRQPPPARYSDHVAGSTPPAYSVADERDGSEESSRSETNELRNRVAAGELQNGPPATVPGAPPSERQQVTYRIETIRPRPTRVGVSGLVEAPKPRIGGVAARTDKKQPLSRVEVILNLRDHSESGSSR
jgi:hypothetical protein